MVTTDKILVKISLHVGWIYTSNTLLAYGPCFHKMANLGLLCLDSLPQGSSIVRSLTNPAPLLPFGALLVGFGEMNHHTDGRD